MGLSMQRWVKLLARKQNKCGLKWEGTRRGEEGEKTYSPNPPTKYTDWGGGASDRDGLL